MGYSSGTGDVHGIGGNDLKRVVDDLDHVSVADEAISCFAVWTPLASQRHGSPPTLGSGE